MMKYDIEKLNDDFVKIKYYSLISAKVQDIKCDKESSSEELSCKIKHMCNQESTRVQTKA